MQFIAIKYFNRLTALLVIPGPEVWPARCCPAGLPERSALSATSYYRSAYSWAPGTQTYWCPHLRTHRYRHKFIHHHAHTHRRCGQPTTEQSWQHHTHTHTHTHTFLLWDRQTPLNLSYWGAHTYLIASARGHRLDCSSPEEKTGMSSGMQKLTLSPVGAESETQGISATLRDPLREVFPLKHTHTHTHINTHTHTHTPTPWDQT